jgi:hypothetical protein
MQRSEMRNTWKQAESHGLKEVPFTTGLHYVERILGPRNDSNYRHFLGHVPHGVQIAAKLVDPLAKLSVVDENPEKVGLDWSVPPGLWDTSLVNTVMEEMVGESSENLTDNNFYDRVVERITSKLWDPKRKPDWLRHLNLLREVFLLHGRVLSAKQVEEFVVALENGADPGTFLPVVNSVKMALLDEVMAKFNQGGEFAKEEDFGDEDYDGAEDLANLEAAQQRLQDMEVRHATEIAEREAHIAELTARRDAVEAELAVLNATAEIPPVAEEGAH